MKSLPAARLSDAIAAIWEVAGNPALWDDALRGINALMPECSGAVVVTPFSEGRGSIWTTIDAPPGFMEEYNANWVGRDTTLHALARRMPIDHLIADRTELIPDPERCDIWQQLYLQHGINDFSSITVNGGNSGGAEAILIAIFADRRKEAEVLRRRRILTFLSRHLRGAAALHWRLSHAQSEDAGTKSILDRINLGIVTLNRQGHVIEANRVARRIIDSTAGLFLAHGKIGSRDPTVDKRLQTAVAAVLSGGAEEPVAILRDRKPALTVIVTPMAVDRNQLAGSTAQAIMFISDPELIPHKAGARIAALYGLTKAEAEIAEAIAAGSDATDIAKQRGTSVHTIRSQIKTMMGKLGATRQSDTVRAILSIPIFDSP